MKFYAVAAAVALAALVAAFGVHLWLLSVAGPGLSTIGIFLDATPVVKLIMVLCILAVLAVIVLAVVGAAAGSAATEIEILLAVVAAGAIVFGALGAAYGEMNIQIAISRVGPVSFAVTAPGHAESALCLSMGLFAGFLGLAGAAWLRARRLSRTPAAAG